MKILGSMLDKLIDFVVLVYYNVCVLVYNSCHCCNIVNL